MCVPLKPFLLQGRNGRAVASCGGGRVCDMLAISFSILSCFVDEAIFKSEMDADCVEVVEHGSHSALKAKASAN